jgi:threonyl-tRNA synthetase
MSQITISLPDGSARELPVGTTGGELAASIGRGLAKAAVAIVVNDAQTDLSKPLPDGAQVAIITAETDEGRHVLRHSTAHVLAQAVIQLFPGAKYTIGPAIENGFYYDFDLPNARTFTEDDLVAVEARMREIVKADQPFVRSDMSAAEALALFADQPYKCEIIERAAAAAGDEHDAGEVSGDVVSVRRSVSRAARAEHVEARSLQAHACFGGVLARQRQGSATATHLRHGVGVEGRA